MIKHLIFDFDGVIVDSEILAAKAFSQVLSNMKIESKYTTEFIAEKFAGNKMIKVAGEICKMHNIKDANSYLNNVMKLVSDLYSKNLKSVNGIDDFLKQNNSNLYISSNSGKQRIIKGLNKVGLANYFKEDKIYTFEMVKNPKPSPDIYIKTIEDNNLDPEESLVFEDSVPGVKAASSANLRVIGVTAASHWKNKKSDSLVEAGSFAIMNSYSEYNKILKLLN